MNLDEQITDEYKQLNDEIKINSLITENLLYEFSKEIYKDDEKTKNKLFENIKAIFFGLENIEGIYKIDIDKFLYINNHKIIIKPSELDGAITDIEKYIVNNTNSININELTIMINNITSIDVVIRDNIKKKYYDFLEQKKEKKKYEEIINKLIEERKKINPEIDLKPAPPKPIVVKKNEKFTDPTSGITPSITSKSTSSTPLKPTPSTPLKPTSSTPLKSTPSITSKSTSDTSLKPTSTNDKKKIKKTEKTKKKKYDKYIVLVLILLILFVTLIYKKNKR